MPSPADATPPGSRASAPGRRSSGSAGCGRCSRRSATRSSRIRRSTSSARTASRPRRGRSRRCSSARGCRSGATVSPHVRSWAERITVDGEEADFEAAIARVRPEAEAQEATQFETICAAAFAEFAARDVDVAVVEAGLGGRLDATNVLRSHVVLLTNVGLEHTDVLGETREEIAAEKLAVVQEGTIAVLPDEEFAHLAGPNVVVGGAREAAEAFLGRPSSATVEVALPGRLERRGDEVLGRRAQRGRRRLARRRGSTAPTTPSWPRSSATRMRTRCSPRWPRPGRRLVATQSSNARALPAEELARLAARHFAEVELEPDPAQRSPALASTARCSSPARSTFSPICCKERGLT